jgi:hypothetical protein
VNDLTWWAHDHTFHTHMRVLELAAYEAILGYDWLTQHNPMVCHWELKTMDFLEEGHQVHLQGIITQQKPLTSISPEQFVKWQKGNDIWAMAMVQQLSGVQLTLDPPRVIKQVIEELDGLFAEPSQLPPIPT